MFKRANLQLTYDVSNEEKKSAEKALLIFDECTKNLNISKIYLNKMKNPFKGDSQDVNNASINPNQMKKQRAALWRFRDKAIENFNEFKVSSFKAVNSLSPFSSDTQTIEDSRAFMNSIDELENVVNEFADLFSDLENAELSKQLVEKIEQIQPKCDAIEDMVNSQIKDHIQKNIQGDDWLNRTSNTFKLEVESKLPKILQLNNQRQEALNDIVKEKKK